MLLVNPTSVEVSLFQELVEQVRVDSGDRYVRLELVVEGSVIVVLRGSLAGYRRFERACQERSPEHWKVPISAINFVLPSLDELLGAESIKAHADSVDLAIVRHQLKPPISTIEHEADRAFKIANAGGDPKDSITVIRNMARMAHRTLNSIGILASIGAGTLQLNRTRIRVGKLASNIRNIGQKMAGVFDSRQIRFSFDEQVLGEMSGRYVDVDEECMEVVFQELLANAAKYSFPNTAVTISGKKSGPKRLSIVVKSIGIQISESDREKSSREATDQIRRRRQQETGRDLGFGW